MPYNYTISTSTGTTYEDENPLEQIKQVILSMQMENERLVDRIEKLEKIIRDRTTMEELRDDVNNFSLYGYFPWAGIPLKHRGVLSAITI